MKILVVDDEEQNVKLLGSLLRAEGYEIETASNGRDAVEKVKAVPPHLVLMDIMMPEMDGYEACSLIKNDAESAHIPVVIVTALSDRESKLRGLEVSANGPMALQAGRPHYNLIHGATMPFDSYVR